MSDRPTGTVTFLFTDVEGSTRLWEEHPEEMRQALARHDELLRLAIEGRGGFVFTTAGDAFSAAFSTAGAAVEAAVSAQLDLRREPWGQVELAVRMAVHTGEAEERDGDYFGPALNRAARPLGAGHGGQVLLSVSTEDIVSGRSPGEWELLDLGEHRLRDLSKPAQVFQLTHPELEHDFPPLRSLDAYPNNLPLQLTSFIGRKDQLDEITELIGEHRLLTLTGVGGSGKTRLALQAAGSVIDGFSDGVWLIELAPIADPAFVPRAVVEGLGVSVRESSTVLESLESFLARRELLLILDNCEHVLEAAAVLTDGLLRAASGVHIVATSREGLAVAGERLWRVPSLRVGAAGDDDWEQARGSEAVRLFENRAAQVQPEFELTAETVPQVVSICRRLDGMPLAIELAAARTRVLPLDNIAERLNDRFRLLTGRSRTAVPRQQTLLATVEWSYELLSERERLLFDRLAVFRGGFTLEAAESVCAGDGLDESEMLDLITQLVDKSLVVAQGGALGIGKFRMLETLRQFSLERLAERRQADQVRRRHAAYFLSLAEQAEPLLETAEMAEWLDRLETEHDNLRAALGWMLDAGGTIDALRMTVALSVWFWSVHSHHEEAYAWHEQTLAAADNAPVGLLASAYAKASTHAAWMARFDRATELANEAIRLATAAGNSRAEIIAHWTHGHVATAGTNDEAAALEHFHEALRLAEAAQDDIWISRSALFIGQALQNLGRHDDAAEYARRSLEAASRADWPMGVGHAAALGSELAISGGDLDRAFELRSEYLTVAKSLDDTEDIAQGYENLALLVRLQGDPERGRKLAREGLGLVSRRTDRIWQARLLAELTANALATDRLEEATDATLEALAIVQGSIYKYSKGLVLSRAATIPMSQGEVERAITLYAVVERLYDESFQPARWHTVEIERDLTGARDRIGPQAFNAAWKTGRSLDPDDATEKAIAWLHELKTETA